MAIYINGKLKNVDAIRAPSKWVETIRKAKRLKVGKILVVSHSTYICNVLKKATGFQLTQRKRLDKLYIQRTA